MIIVGKLKAEINVKEEMVKELQKKLKSSEETFKRSLQGMTAEIVSLKKNLKEKDDEISSLHPKLIAHPASALSSVASFKGLFLAFFIPTSCKARTELIAIYLRVENITRN